MLFCNKCQNYMEYKEDFENTKLYYYCFNCNYISEENLDNVIIYEKLFDYSLYVEQNYNNLKYDKTLPKSKEKCKDCKKFKTYIRDKELQIIYFCNCN